MKTLKEFALEKGGVWRYFDLVCSTPHPSGHEKKLVDLLIEEAGKHGLSARTDDFGNLRIDRKGDPGFEDMPCLILQAHLDMVPQKAPGSTFNFLTDPLNVVVTGQKIHCSGETTLGADDGIGVALAMDLITDPEIKCGPLAALFTREEEIGLNGARAVSAEFLQGAYLLNLDSGCDSCFYAGCAGGVENFGFFTPEYLPAPAGQAVKIEVKNLDGGHSGADIHLKRGNAHKFLAFFLDKLQEKIAVSSFEGGSVVNAISRESAALGVLQTSLEDAQESAAETAFELAKSFNAPAGFGFEITPCATPEKVWTSEFQCRFLTMLNTLPDGVFEFSEELDCVSSSCNVGLVLPTSDGKIKVGCHPRAFDDEKWQKISLDNKEHFEKAGGEFAENGPYPGWKFKADSKLLAASQKACEKVYGSALPVRAIHAGLEPGMFTPLAPGLEMLSFAPADHHCHTTEEYLETDSAEKVALWLRELLKVLR